MNKKIFDNFIEKITKIAKKRQVDLLLYIDERQMLSFCEIRPKCRIKHRVFMLGVIEAKGNYREKIGD